ncbi:MAG: capsid protein [Circoviridae sp.]|nr:MAG: capsid protein [Circoviridae sp.]
MVLYFVGVPSSFLEPLNGARFDQSSVLLFLYLCECNMLSSSVKAYRSYERGHIKNRGRQLRKRGKASAKATLRERRSGLLEELIAERAMAAPSRPGVEKKWKDVFLGQSLGAAGTIVRTSINLIAQGTGESERLGRKVTLTQISVRYTLEIPETTAIADASDTIRLIVYLDRQTNGATAGITDILQDDHYLSFNNLDNNQRFLTLMDRTHDLNPQAGYGNGTTNETAAYNYTDSWYKSVDIPVEFSGTAGLIGEITSNNVGILALTREGLVDITMRTRVRFLG